MPKLLGEEAMTSIPELLEKLEALHEKATKGPWDAYFETGIRPLLVTFIEDENGRRQLVDAVPRTMENMELIAELRNSFPRLRDSLRAAVAWLEADDAFQAHRGSDGHYNALIDALSAFRASLGPEEKEP